MRWILSWSAVVLGAALWSASPTWAHHPTQVTRLSASTTTTTGQALHGRLLLRLGHGHQVTHFGHTLVDADRRSEAETPVSLDISTTRLTLQLPTSTAVQLAMRVGTQVVADTSWRPMLGDTDLVVTQDLLAPLAALRPFASWTVSGTLRLPTGDAADAVALQDVFIADGEVQLLTTQMQSSMTMGAPWAAVSTRLQVRPWWWLGGSLSAMAGAPLTSTHQGVRWGPDAGIDAQIDTAPGLRWVRMAAGVDLRLHGEDQALVWAIDDDTGKLDVSTPPQPMTGGQRIDVGGLLIASLATSWGDCSAGGRLPLWQAVSGMQLVESFTVFANCAVQLQHDDEPQDS